ncbi:hypothetical protein [Magnetospirillum sulfuroxidans]|uniref:Apea-like HEPN domain-containing protein n=1 Tax=Magnetospirillum sulfuroxidans TaxID=611300 RepID=A0ABS5II03_9PROT|nr:hypothetical protein [Magnetospirillum sulfuroxidans]MBR9973338.1 hypothetical protein [Magnetospirillum sulfuroxidans]
MTILDRLQRFAEVGTVITCSKMTLLAGDNEPPLVVGSGEVVVSSETSFCYRIQGVPEDIGHALRTLNRIQQDPYDGCLRERLEAVAEDGTRLLCGWTIAKVDPGGHGEDWIFSGEFDSIIVTNDGPTALFTEVIYLLPAHHMARIVLRRFFPKPGVDGKSVHRMSILDTDVTFTLDDQDNKLLIHAPGTTQLPVTFTENWLGEPLRILFGQLIYPRFVARGIGTYVMNWVRPSPPWSERADACALWQGEKAFIDKEGFWTSYARLLAYVASVRDFEANAITELYVEVIQASSGSRWVWALTYASAAEGLVNLIFPRGSWRSDMETTEIAKLETQIDKFKAYIDLWTGDARFKKPAKNAASRILETSAAIGLRQLRDAGWVTADQYKAWDTLRNKVMHGNLVSPYSSAKDDKLLLDISGLLHALTRRIIAGVDPATGTIFAPPPPVSGNKSTVRPENGKAQG